MATNFAVFKLSFNPQNVAGYVPPYIFAEIRSTKADKDLFSFKVFELWIFENTQKWKRHHDAAWTIYPPLSFTVIRILAVSACALTLDVSVTGIFWKTSRHQILSSVTLSWHGHAPSFSLTHSLQCRVCSGLRGHTPPPHGPRPLLEALSSWAVLEVRSHLYTGVLAATSPTLSDVIYAECLDPRFTINSS